MEAGNKINRALVIDTRQQEGKHVEKHSYFNQAGITTIRSKLAFGDYAVVPAVAVDTKASISEIWGNITQDHERFRRECVHARECGCQLVILVENTYGIKNLNDLAAWMEPEKDWRKRNRGKSKRIDGSRLAKAMDTMRQKYGVLFDFCPPERAARRILEIISHYEGGEK